MEKNNRKFTSAQINTFFSDLLKRSIPVLLYYFFILIVILLIVIFSYSVLKKRFIAQKGLEISSIAELKVQQIKDFRERCYRDGKLFHDNQSFIRTVKSFVAHRDPEGEKELYDWFKPILDDRFFDAIVIIDVQTKKNIFAITYNNLEYTDSTGSGDLECIHADSIQFSDLFFNTNKKTIQMCVFVPLILKDGTAPEKIAVVKLVINPYNKLYGLMQSMPNSGKSGEVLVVRKDGDDVLYLNELRFRKNSALKFRLPADLLDLPASKALRGDESVSEGIDYRGKKVLAIESFWFKS